MAEIWLAHLAGPEGFAKLVVIKKIKPHLAKERSFVKMFLNEARLAAQLNHPHIVQIYDMGKIEGTYFIAMEYISGRDLSEIALKAQTEKIPFPAEYAIKIITQICEGLYYAHCKTDHLGNPLNLVHRDISPQNIFVSFDGGVKILDFGIAKASNSLEQTQEGTLKGKVSYMSPEQILDGEVDQRSDIFSLGIVFYELVTGYRLFSGENELAILKSIAEGPIYPPSYFKEDLPWELEPIILKALAKDPEARYQNAWEIQYELNNLLSKFSFNPSNLHLSNFLKQLFADEIARENRYLEKKIAEILGTQQAIDFTSAHMAAVPDPTPLSQEVLSNLQTPDEDDFSEPDTQDLAPRKKPLPSVDLDTDPDLEALSSLDLLSEAPPSVELLPSAILSETDEHTIGPKPISIELRRMPTPPPSPKGGESEPFDPELYRGDPFSEGPTALAPAPLEALHASDQELDGSEDGSEILYTLRFRSAHYKTLKSIAEKHQLSFEQLLHDMLKKALPFYQTSSLSIPSRSTAGKKY
ncbi:MAG: serine/threonine protein kinase [Myxococcales bacterium]|nr:serine/threonine protein kinase [Myxococcales bacterium]